jgi:hypothetical protein
MDQVCEHVIGHNTVSKLVNKKTQSIAQRSEFKFGDEQPGVEWDEYQVNQRVVANLSYDVLSLCIGFKYVCQASDE